MPTIARCTCGQDMQVLDEDLGVPVECPRCRRHVVVQRGSTVAIPVPPAVPQRVSVSPMPDSRLRLRPHNGRIVLLFGLMAFMPCLGIVFAIAAWVMARNDLLQMDEGTMDPAGRGFIRAGKILAIISILLYPIWMFLSCLGGLLG